MSDDWRVRVTLPDANQAVDLADQLQQGGLEHALATGAGDRVVVSVDERDVFLYADTREQAERALQAIGSVATGRGWSPETELRRWHPTAEEWEDPDAPLPEAGPEVAAERAELMAREQEESQALGYGEYEVRVHCGSHHETVALADRLREEGLNPVRRWRFLLVPAPDEDSAQALADRLTREAPPGSTVRVEGSLTAVEAETPPNPFAVFGGLGG